MQTTAQPDSQAVLYLNTFDRVVGTEALTVPEILGTILDYLPRPTLVSAACVSKAWSPIALDKLWSNHDVTVVDLLRILPLKSRYKHLAYVRVRKWTLQRSPTDDEWARFTSYASLVRSLSISHPEPDIFDSRITKWKVANDVLFPRLRRIQCYSPRDDHLGIPQLRSYVTSGLRELYLAGDEYGNRQQVVAFLNDLARIEGLRLEKLKLGYQEDYSGSTLPKVIANLVAANKGSISALELPGSDLEISVLANHSLQNLKALDIDLERVQVERVPDQIQALVEVCPHVVYLRLWVEKRRDWVDALDFSAVRKILAWRLLSFELRGSVRLGKESIGEMANAWPGLKKLSLNPATTGLRIYLPLSLLGDILAAFPELEDLNAPFGAPFGWMRDDVNVLTNLPSSQYGCPSSLRKLGGDMSSPPPSQTHQDLVAEFLARVLPPGLRIESGPAVYFQWFDLFRRVEELHGGVRLQFGGTSEENGGVWF